MLVELHVKRNSICSCVSMASYHHHTVIDFTNLSDVLSTDARCCAAALAMTRVVQDEIETISNPGLSARLQNLQAPIIYSASVPRRIMNEMMQAVVIAIDVACRHRQNVLSLRVAQNTGEVIPKVLPLSLSAKDIENFEHQLSKNCGIASATLSFMTLPAVYGVTTAQYDPLRSVWP